MKNIRAYTTLLGIVTVCFSLAVPMVAQSQDEISAFFEKWEYEVSEGDRVIIATIVSLVPSSQRMVVKSERNDETLVLGLEDGVEMKHGADDVAIEALDRGEAYILTLSKANMKVNGIYRYE